MSKINTSTKDPYIWPQVHAHRIGPRQNIRFSDKTAMFRGLADGRGTRWTTCDKCRDSIFLFQPKQNIQYKKVSRLTWSIPFAKARGLLTANAYRLQKGLFRLKRSEMRKCRMPFKWADCRTDSVCLLCAPRRLESVAVRFPLLCA